MAIIDFGGSAQKISIYDLLHKELRCADVASNGKLYPENRDKPYSVTGVLIAADITPYHKIEIANTTWGVPIGEFTISGVIKESSAFLTSQYGPAQKDSISLLAFRYEAGDHMPSASSHKPENFAEYIQSQREGRYANYLHLAAMLRSGKPRITLEGKVYNSSPRLFLPHGIMVEADTLRTRHGFIHAEQDNPVYR